MAASLRRSVRARSARRGVDASRDLVVLACALLLGVAVARADGPPVVLRTTIDETIAGACPTGAEIDARLVRYLETVPPRVTPLEATLVVAPGDDGVLVTLTVALGGRSEERLLAGPCPSSIDAALLALAMHAETAPEPSVRVTETLAVVETGADPTTAVDAESEPSAGSPPHVSGPLEDPSRELASGRRPGPRISLRLRGSLTAAFSSAPQPAMGAALEVGLGVEWLEITLGALWASETQASSSSGRGVAVTLASALVRLAARIDVDIVSVLPSVRFGAGAQIGRGVGADRVFTQGTPWVELGGGVELRVRLPVEPALALSLWGDLVGELTSPRFVVADEVVFVPSDVGGLVGLGLWASFP